MDTLKAWRLTNDSARSFSQLFYCRLRRDSLHSVRTWPGSAGRPDANGHRSTGDELAYRSDRSEPIQLGVGIAPSGFLTGNRDFANFIGFISAPPQSIDPRATTELWPLFGAGWVAADNKILPSGSMQVYGAGLNVALSDRLSFGLNNGGYAQAQFSNDLSHIYTKLGLPIPVIDRPGVREGWLNLGGYLHCRRAQPVPAHRRAAH
jgi:hypothetical protein